MDDGDVLVEIWTQGPLHVRLHLSDGICQVKRFERDVTGSISEIELDGRVNVGDALVSVNNISVAGMNMPQIQEIIQKSVSNEKPRMLLFRRYVVAPDSEAGKAFGLTKPVSPMLLSTSSGSSSDSPSTRLSALMPLRRIDIFHSILRDKLISEGKLRNLAASGIPDQQGIRGVLWRLLLRTLPLDTDSWPEALSEKRLTYEAWCSKYFVEGTAELLKANGATSDTSEHENHTLDHPLSEGNNVAWMEYLSDAQLMEEIEKDVIRTHPDISFFIDEDNTTQVKACMMRMLFIFAKEHPNVRYVQGMNDLCGTLFFVLATDEAAEWRSFAEADAYFCFDSLVMENQDMFIKTLDQTETGIHGRIQQFTDLLRVHDNELFVLFRRQGIDPSFYGLRWLTTLLCREFNLPDTIRVWDALFADTDRAEFLAYVCCTMVMEQREKLIEGDFALNLQLLQAYPSVDITHLLSTAMSMRSSDRIKALGMGPDVSPGGVISKGGVLGFGWADAVLGDEEDEETPGDAGFNLRNPRLNKIGANIVGAISHTGNSVSSFFNSAEAGMRKLFSEKPSGNQLWPNMFASPPMDQSTEGDLK
jgi:hypothetical protein